MAERGEMFSFELEVARRHLRTAETAHAENSREASNWYLRSIARYLEALCCAELKRMQDKP
jgi:hypothetical protein